MKLEFLRDGGPECPLIRFFGTDTDTVRALIEKIEQLTKGIGESVHIDEVLGIQFNTDSRLILLSSNRNIGVSTSSMVGEFTWELTPEKWSLVAGLLEPFAVRPRRGIFQWLTGPMAEYGLDVGSTNVLVSFSEDGLW